MVNLYKLINYKLNFFYEVICTVVEVKINILEVYRFYCKILTIFFIIINFYNNFLE